ncbi:hypothetical protein BDBG_16428 [Blastomyces gilchristii SLH14081]|uniref:Uncharacterized protein n=1 Tax=Blastomyces gilchristii (strain SLH14081) TaxID=559298 RepID=A0A179UDP0_BLAGS|nr:uncharacterized protein BDBG_16428 [Blastomyces gilchristii SLH14081]OAT05171.1 hypothetical protein BDBG_16428 [Blastomyces gilchristii SLH14081]
MPEVGAALQWHNMATLSIVGTTTLYTVGLTEDEELMVSQLADSLEADHARDEIAETYLYYCT